MFSFSIVQSKDATRALVVLEKGVTSLDRELVINIEQQEPFGLSFPFAFSSDLCNAGSRAVIERFAEDEKIGAGGFAGNSVALQVTFCEKAVTASEVMETDLVRSF